MRKKLLLIALATPLLAQLASGQQGFDFSSLDRLADKAINKTIVTLNSDMLKLAANFLGGDKDAASIRAIVQNLKGIYVREYEFGKEGQYTDADLAPMRALLQRPPWNKIVESTEAGDKSEVWAQPLPNDRLGGIAVISCERKELTVVYIDGVMNMSDIAKLSGNLGVPEIKLDPGKKSTDKSEAKPK